MIFQYHLIFIDIPKTMSKFNPFIHDRRSIRLKGYDYSKEGLYFITICCHNRAHLFGKIVREEIEPPGSEGIQKMELNDAGHIANDCWLAIPDHFPHAVLHEHVIMPNHVHGIIELISRPGGAENLPPNNVKGILNENLVEHDKHLIINPPVNLELHKSDGANGYSPPHVNFRSPSKTIGSIVRGFKIGVTKWMRQHTKIEEVWQRNYHEHIIRDNRAYENISRYIINNPTKWHIDKFNKT